ncbi:peptidoglycan-associated lipoprotein [Rhodoferax koreense]|uniref:Peptidoglycan-associated lipoprotein n=1 Tax=Rhodoferax koreensis TaxID=1842727 RepID=A0A1P8JWD7_9BURK|nr:peptidoglycan-associated lipoprotein Pal [Rhodoferax koreense]APW37991.1 peptidoglycan-associated lipoprotein [Rhodoferax koreense]
MKRFVWALSMTAVLAGCASGVKLDDVPVVDKSGTSVGAGGAGAAGSTQSAVTSVDLSAQNQSAAGPNSGRIVYFDFDSYSVRPDDQAVIDANARYLKANSARKAVVEGHTDERGGREYNLALGQKRSEAVRRSLTLLGVSDAQVEAVSFGKEKPAATGSDEASMAKNRRAEITYR